MSAALIVFHSWDADGDGQLSGDEFYAGLCATNSTRSSSSSSSAAYDENENENENGHETSGQRFERDSILAA